MRGPKLPMDFLELRNKVSGINIFDSLSEIANVMFETSGKYAGIFGVIKFQISGNQTFSSESFKFLFLESLGILFCHFYSLLYAPTISTTS